MKVYLAKFTMGVLGLDDGLVHIKVAYKIGVTLHNDILKRFGDSQYQIFNSIEEVTSIQFSRKSYNQSRLVAETIEAVILSFIPKNFRLEKYFNQPDNTFNHLSGITEMFVLPHGEFKTEADLIDLIDTINHKVNRLLRKYDGELSEY